MGGGRRQREGEGGEAEDGGRFEDTADLGCSILLVPNG